MKPKWKQRYFDLENEIIKQIKRQRYYPEEYNELLNHDLNHLLKLSYIIRRKEDWKEIKDIKRTKDANKQ